MMDSVNSLSVVSSTSAPAAPYPANTKAKGWRFELDYERIEQSDTWVLAPPEMRPWLLMLWMTAWRQVPCGSLPAAEELIAARIGLDVRQFRAHRDILLRGWWLADDGRLYHPVITEQVSGLRVMRDKEAARKQSYREKKNQQHTSPCPAGQPRDSAWSPVVVTPPEPEPDKAIQNPPTPLPGGSLKAVKGKAASIPSCPESDIVALYHSTLPDLPRCRLMPKARSRAIRSMWTWILTSKRSDGAPRATTAAEAMDWLKAYFERATDNDFLMGRTKRSEEHSGWRCDLDFLLTTKGLKQVIEKTQEAA